MRDGVGSAGYIHFYFQATEMTAKGSAVQTKCKMYTHMLQSVYIINAEKIKETIKI